MHDYRSLFVALSFIFTPAFASAFQAAGEPEVSAVRNFRESEESAYQRHAKKLKSEQRRAFAASSSARSVARNYHSGFDVSPLPDWSAGLGELTTVFLGARDERRYIQRSRPNFPRRMTWLYPADGCYVRAAHIAQSAARQGWPRPGKVFAFGKLSLQTPYAPRGRVYWWYHVATAYRVGGQAMVVDPGVSQAGPLPLDQWLARISTRIEGVKVSLCDSYAYGPSSRCIGGSKSRESGMRRHLEPYLTREWNNLKTLSLSPERLLGEEPPWATGFRLEYRQDESETGMGF